MMVHVLPDESKFGHLGESFASLATSVSVVSGRGEQVLGKAEGVAWQVHT